MSYLGEGGGGGGRGEAPVSVVDKAKGGQGCHEGKDGTTHGGAVHLHCICLGGLVEALVVAV